MTYAEATAVRAEEPGRFSGTIEPGWDIVGNANGGYLLALIGRALRETSGRDDPVSVTGHYLRPGKPGPVTIRTETVKEGRAFATVRGTMSDADDKALLTVLGTFGTLSSSTDLAAERGPELVDAAPPDLPSYEDCAVREGGPGGAAPSFMDKVALRLHPDDAGFATGMKTGRARMRGWFALPDGEPIDTIGLLTAVDAFPPTIFNTDFPVAWAPTVELTAHLRARPEPGPLRCVFTTRFVTGGFLEADGEIWDATDRLVAQSRQLALVPR